MDIKLRLREARWAWWLPAAILVGICILPSGHIEASPGEFLHPPVWMAPMAWPLFAMGFVFGAAAFSVRLRRHAWHILFLGTGAALIFNLLLIASSGAAALYSWELGTNLQNRIFTDFELDILAFFVQPMALLLLAVSALVLWVRGGKPGPEEPGLLFPAAPPSSPEGRAAEGGQRAEIPELPAVPATGAEAMAGGAETGEKAPGTDSEAGQGAPAPPPPPGPASPLDTITVMAPEAKPEMTAKAPAGPGPAPPAAAPGSPPETAPPDGGFTP